LMYRPDDKDIQTSNLITLQNEKKTTAQ
jgi:hypothetical protein